MIKRNVAVFGIVILFLGLVFNPVANSSVINKENEKDILIKNFILENDTIYVDDDNVDGPWDGSLEHPYKTISDAMEHQCDGLTIFVFSGNYTENLKIITSINLTGEDKNNTIISEKEGYTEIIEIKSSYVRISGFTFKGNKNKEIVGIRIEEKEGIRRAKNNISNNIFIDFYKPAIYMRGWNDPQRSIFTNNIIHGDFSITGTIRGNIISNNKFGKNSDINIKASMLGYILSNIITNNTFEEGSDIFITDGSAMNNKILNNYLKKGNIKITTSFDNTISNNTLNGGKITLGTKNPRNEGNNNIIENNLIVSLNSDEAGIEIFNEHFDKIRNNNLRNSKGILIDGVYVQHLSTHKLKDNYVDGKLISYHCNEDGGSISGDDIATVFLVNCKNFKIRNLEIRNHYGITIISSSNIEVFDNSILDTHSFGIKLIDSSNNIIHDNTLIRSGYGILLRKNCRDNEIYGNNIQYGSIGIKLVDSPSNHIYRNVIINAWEYGLYAKDSDNGEIYENHFEKNYETSLFLEYSSRNLIKKNNFIKSGLRAYEDVIFKLKFNDKPGNKFIRNYYSKHKSWKPNFIKGKLKTIFFVIVWDQTGPRKEDIWIPWYDVDWLPAKNKYSSDWMGSENRIKVTSPGYKDKWQVGTSHLIQWEYVEDLGEKVTISLQKENNPGFVHELEIADSISNSQMEYLWTIPSSIASGDGYYIIITGEGENTFYIVSNKFSIINNEKQEGDITLYKPQTNETWETGSSYDITWGYTGNIGDNIVLTLHKLNDTYFMKKIGTLPIGDEKYPYKVPKDLPAEKGYFIIIWSETSDVYNISGVFEIKEGRSKSINHPKLFNNPFQKFLNYFPIIKQLLKLTKPFIYLHQF